MDNTWRSGMPRNLRQQYVDRIMESVQIYLDAPPTLRLVRGDLRTLALVHEEAIFLSATDQSDYAIKISAKKLALETMRARARVTDIGRVEATDIQESPGAVPVQNLSDQGPLQEAGSGEEEVSASFPKAMFMGLAGFSMEEILTAVMQDFPNAVVIETSDGDINIFVLDFLPGPITIFIESSIDGDVHFVAL